jgi:heme-degrading monooxygenase HmoA
MNQMPELPYYAVIFTSLKTQESEDYDKMAERMEMLGSSQPGFLGIQSARGDDGIGITASYWKTLADVAGWKANMEHKVAQGKGKSDWYQGFEVRICKVERQYSFGDLSNG